MPAFRLLGFASLVLAAVTIGMPATGHSVDAVLVAASNANRAADRSLDQVRKGPQIASFIGIREADRIIEIIPSGGYWTRLFANIVGPRGRVAGLWPEPYARADFKNVGAYLAMSQLDDFQHVHTYIEPAALISVDAAVDLVFTAMNYHDYPDAFLGSVSPDTLNRQVYSALKPGGVYIVIDHAGFPGSGMSQISSLHRIDPEVVRRQVEAAGFEFVGESNLLRNPADDHKLSVFEDQVRGKTDRFIYKFRKPE